MPIPCVVLVPVKSPAVAKSRLGGLGDPVRRGLARAFALDTVTVARAVDAVAGVVVSTDDAEVAQAAASLGCLVVSDAGGLNDSLHLAAATAATAWPEAVPVALCGDLPALAAADLASALAQVRADHPCFVADAAGTGTTLYAAGYATFAPAFGPGSAAGHRSAGARELPGHLTTLRLDVDDPRDLAAAVALGVGAHTRRVLTDPGHSDGGEPPGGSPPS